MTTEMSRCENAVRTKQPRPLPHWLKMKDLPPAIHERFNYIVSLRTLARLRREQGLRLPCTQEELYEWFEAVMTNKTEHEREERQTDFIL